MTTTPGSVAIAVVTYNRADMLAGMLEGLGKLDRLADRVIVVDNASTDHTAEVLAASDLPHLQVITSPENLGGAGGFRMAVKAAYDQGHEWMWLMDDDVVPAPDCLDTLLAAAEQDGLDAMISVREDREGRLVELAATRFDLTHAHVIKPKVESVMTAYGERRNMPERVEVENVAFEGFMVNRRVIDAIGLPDDSYFIFYDDVDFAIRARRAGFRIWAIRDAVLVRQLDFSQQHDLSSWKGYYMYRNLFVVHMRYGDNVLVRLKPWLITLAVIILSPWRDGWSEVRNVTRGVRDARRMRSVPPASVD